MPAFSYLLTIKLKIIILFTVAERLFEEENLVINVFFISLMVHQSYKSCKFELSGSFKSLRMECCCKRVLTMPSKNCNQFLRITIFLEQDQFSSKKMF